MNFGLKCKVELFKRKEFEKIPLHVDRELGVFYFSKKQIQALEYLTDHTTAMVGYGGGAYSGKTALEIYWATLSALAYPGTAYGIGRKTITTLNQTVLETMFKIFDGEGLREDIDFRYRGGSTNRVWLRTHKSWKKCSSFFLLHMAYKPTDPLYTRFGGLELTSAAVDESNENDYQAIGILNSRLNRRKNEQYNIPAKLLETFNPDKGHVYRRYYKPWRDEVEKENRKFVRALPADNPHPSVPAYIKRIVEEGDLVTTERLVHGNFDYSDDPMIMVDQGALDDMWTNTFVDRGERRIVVDVAGQGRDLTVAWVFEGLVGVDRVTEKKSDKHSVKKLIQKLKLKWRVSDRNIIVDGNGVGAEVADIMPSIKRFIANKRPDSGYQDGFFAIFKDQCGYKLADLVNENQMWVDNTKITERATDKVKEEFAVLKRVETGDKPKKILPKDGDKGMKSILGRSPDDLDCFLMLMYFYLIKDKSAKRWKG